MLRLLAGILLLEAVVCGGIFTIRYSLDFADGMTYYALYKQEKVEGDFYKSKVECAYKLNGCSKRYVENAIRKGK